MNGTGTISSRLNEVRPWVEFGLVIATILVGAGVVKESYASLQRDVVEQRELVQRELADIRRLMEVRDDRARTLDARVAEQGAMLRALERRLFDEDHDQSRRGS